MALPSEHGGWGLSSEPGLLGLLLVPSLAGAALALAALVAFLARTPAKSLLVDLHRRRRTDRTALAAGVLLVEAAGLGALAAVAVVRAGGGWARPIAVAAPLVAVELRFAMRSRARRLAPELAGAVGIGATAAAVVLAGGGGERTAIAAWMLLAGRSLTAIPHVRARVAALHGRAVGATAATAGDLAAVALAAGAVAADASMAFGAVVVAALPVVHRGTARREVRSAKVVGMQQMALGLGVVVVAALGHQVLA